MKNFFFLLILCCSGCTKFYPIELIGSYSRELEGTTYLLVNYFAWSNLNDFSVEGYAIINKKEILNYYNLTPIPIDIIESYDPITKTLKGYVDHPLVYAKALGRDSSSWIIDRHEGLKIKIQSFQKYDNKTSNQCSYNEIKFQQITIFQDSITFSGLLSEKNIYKKPTPLVTINYR